MDVSVTIKDYPKGYSDQDYIRKNVEELLCDLQLDVANYGTDSWNPFKEIIKENDVVVIKPNLVLHTNGDSIDIDAVVCHSAVMRPVVDYTLKALHGTGKLIIADAPMGNADFQKVIERNGLKALAEEYKAKGIEIEVRDLRGFYYPTGFFTSTRQAQEGDPEGMTELALGKESYLSEIGNLDLLYGADFDRSFIVDQHKQGQHKYMISNTILHADVIISMPKMKTHQKTGMTVNLKNLVGINGNKNYLAHYRVGSPKKGGDEYEDSRNVLVWLYRWAWRISRDKFLSRNTMWGRYVHYYFFRYIMAATKKVYGKHINEKGGWYGNDTCWRMCLDLNYILRYADKQGKISNIQQRKYFCLVDGIVAGEGDGPLSPTPVNAGVLMAANNPYYADFVCAHVMGFDPHKVPYIEHCQNGGRLPELSFDNMDVSCKQDGIIVDFRDVNLHFEPQAGWKGHIEK